MKTTIPEDSWRNPWAASAPIRVAMIAVSVSRTMFANMAIGAAERNRRIFLVVERVERKASAALRANMLTSDRNPEQAATTSRVVSARCRIFPSLYIGIPIKEMTCSVR